MRATSPSLLSRFVAAGASIALVTVGVALANPASAAAAKATATKLAAVHPTAGVATTLTASVSPKPTGGTVKFTAAGKSIASCTKAAVSKSTGKATCKTTFASVGSRAVVAAYSGKTPTYKASSGKATVTVAKAVPGQVVGGVGACTTTKGALVAASFAPWSGPIVRGCGTTLTTGRALLTAGGFAITGTQRFPAFICRLAHPLFNSSTAYPTSTQDACVNTPPASAYWSFWTAAKGVNTWTYSPTGADGDKPVAGEVEAWTYGNTDIGGTSGKPTFTPNEIRTGLPAAAAAGPKTTTTAAPKAAKRTAVKQSAQRRAAAAATPDLDAAVQYLTDNLVDGTHYEPFGPGFPDVGLTLDAAFALAANGSADDTLADITSYVATNQNDFTFLNGPNADFASGGAVGKVALLAEVTGNDPRAFGGVDLIAGLDGLNCTDGTTTGCAGAGNYLYAQSVFSQALGVIAQLRAGDTAGAAGPVTFLLGLQHASGAFPSVIPGSDSDVDSTAMAAMALALLPDDAAAQTALDKALTWIAGQQEADGGFPGAAGDSTNSAGLASQGLTLGGSAHRTAIDDAVTFLAARQNSDGGFDVAAGGQEGSDLRASAQAVAGVIGTPLGTLTDDITAPAPDLDVDAGASYLVDQLTDGTHLEFAGGFGPNFGGTADIALALAASGSDDDTLIGIVKYLSKHVADYADPAGTGEFPGPYTGAAGKLAVLAEITGQDPHDFGGFDLLKVLTDHVCAAPDTAGACTAAGDFYQNFSTVSQALGVLALARGGVDVPTAALARLEDLQCSDGGFSSALLVPGGDCTSEVDTTGFALQALVLIPSAADAAAHAVKFLRNGQLPSGGWTGAAGESTNSTALAVEGLLAAPASADFGNAPNTKRATGIQPHATKSDPAVKAALGFLAGLQNPDGGFGISTDSHPSDEAATAQAVPAAAGTTLTTLVHHISLASVPGEPTDPGGTPVPGSDSSQGSGGGAPAANGAIPADTGSPTGELLGYAALLLVVGGALSIAGRRSSAGLAGRHRQAVQ
jgi:prenyltransferase beta subunit